jgi:putative membrane protein
VTVLLLALGALLGATPAPPANPALDDATIVAIFDAANTYDIETGKLALQTSHTKAVRDLAQQFGHDHAAVRQQGRDLAKKLNLTPTPPKENPLAPDHERALKELKTKKGAEFDRAYLDEEVRYHQAVLDAVSSTLLPAITNAQLKAFVEKVGPAFQGHLEAAKQLQKQLATTTAGK